MLISERLASGFLRDGWQALRGDAGSGRITQSLREVLVVLLITVTVGASIVRANVHAYADAKQAMRGYSDINIYVSKVLRQEHPTWAYRPVVPALVRTIPDIPETFFASSRGADERFRTAIKFAIFNLACVVLTSLLLYAFQRRLGIGFAASLVGVFLYLGSATVVRGGGLPTTDIAFHLFIMLTALAVHMEDPWLTAVALGVGMFTKELMALGLLLIVLAPIRPRRKALLAAIGGLALAVYLVAARSHPPLAAHVARSVRFEYAETSLSHFFRANGWLNLYLAFGLAWIPAIAALRLRATPLILRRWAWILPVLFIGCILEGENINRGMFAMFPIVIPLATWGLNRWIPAGLDRV